MTCTHCGRDEAEQHRDDCRLALALDFRDGVFGTDDDLFFTAFRAFVESRAASELLALPYPEIVQGEGGC